MGLVYGIDFGTSNSAIMVGRPGGEVKRIRNPVESIYEIPTAVCLRPNGKMAVGSVAQRMKLQRPAWYRDEFKRDIGSTDPVIFPPEGVGGPENRRFAVHQLAAEVLRVLREQAESEVPGEADLVVITVPASWQAGNREYMYLAAAAAGFDPERVRLVKEPEAAVAYAVEKHLGAEERTLLVYDLGGGTFDCAVVRGRGHTGFGLLGEAGGLDNIGGTDFDHQILELIKRRFPVETSELLTGPAQDPRVLARRLQLRDTCENAKRVLSTEMLYEGYLTELETSPSFEFSRGDLAELIGSMVEETVAECERLLLSLGMDWSDIDNVVPVGGSSRLPIVGETIARHSTRGRASVIRVDDPELAVVHGAVLHAFALRGANSALLTPTPTQPPAVDYGDAVKVDAEPAGADSEPARADPEPAETEVPAFGTWTWGAVPTVAEESAAEEEPVPEEPALVAEHVPAEEPALVEEPAKASADEQPKLPPSMQYTALQASPMALAWRSNHNALWIAAVASIVALLNQFNLIASPKDLRTALAIAAYSLVGLLVLQMAFTAWALNRALELWEAVAASSASFAFAATAHYFLNGWLGWTVLIILLVIGAGSWTSMSDEPVTKMCFLKGVQFHNTGIKLTFGDDHTQVVPWSVIESITQSGNLLKANLTAGKRTPARTRLYGLKYNDKANDVELFRKYHFAQYDQILQDIRVYTAGRLSITAPSRTRQSRSRRTGDR